ncbi:MULTISPECIES: cytidylyltransferase domain-containing protein [Thalassospira]|uniref:Spore coat biosynthesis protein F n=1 Tax=Thalassospira profundimaris TaxID=502049 RepID=A0A367VLY8_9PROT|nr:MULTISPECIES: glycosyltransferase family protein [Thalassospira]KZB71718.1 spore coat biosynthesis protein F [Thalassospira sp. MCCC 1A01148]MBR9899345.1 NTP transferase domain-containing protein [Rhodospirillales bacterium]RCK25422.1 spore coat biosynthesis protein F [Thalassospira profundimaris]
MVHTAITIQARMTSTRLPGKVLKPVMGRTLLELMVERLRRIQCANEIILCTTENATDDVLAAEASRLGILCFRGSEEDVMSRVLGAAKYYDVEHIIETTGDCPLIDPGICDKVFEKYRISGADYCSNIYKRCFPIGMDVQVFSTRVLADAFARTNDLEEREHVSLFIYRHPELYSLEWIEASAELFDPNLRLTVDTEDDYKLVTAVYEDLYPNNPNFELKDILQLVASRPDLRALNDKIQHKWVQY